MAAAAMVGSNCKAVVVAAGEEVVVVLHETVAMHWMVLWRPVAQEVKYSLGVRLLLDWMMYWEQYP